MVTMNFRLSRTHIRSMLVALLLGTCAVAALPQTPPYVALVTALDGRVMIKKTGRTDFEKGVWGAQLHRGDQIRTLENARVSLLFENSNLITLGSNSNLTIADNTPPSAQKSVRVASPALASDLSLLTFRESGNGEAGALAGLRAGGDNAEITAITPRQSKIRSLQPSFEWLARRPFESFTITVMTDSGVLWERRSPAGRLAYPADAQALERGHAYVWTVEGENLFEHAKSPGTAFSVLSPEETQSVAEQEEHWKQMIGSDETNTTLRLLLGAYYDRQGLLMDAITQFQQIAATNPDAPLPHEILGRLYEKVGLKDQAIRELQNAVTSSRESR
jgi:hypothetical protein